MNPWHQMRHWVRESLHEDKRFPDIRTFLQAIRLTHAAALQDWTITIDISPGCLEAAPSKRTGGI